MYLPVARSLCFDPIYEYGCLKFSIFNHNNHGTRIEINAGCMSNYHPFLIIVFRPVECVNDSICFHDYCYWLEVKVSKEIYGKIIRKNTKLIKNGSVLLIFLLSNSLVCVLAQKDIWNRKKNKKSNQMQHKYVYKWIHEWIWIKLSSILTPIEMGAFNIHWNRFSGRENEKKRRSFVK